MMTWYLLLSMLLTAAGNGLLCLGRRQLWRKAAVCTITELLLVYGFHWGLCRFTLCEAPAVPVIAFAFAVCLVSAILLYRDRPENRLHRFLYIAARMVCLSFFLEIFVFCASSYSLHPAVHTPQKTAVSGHAEPAPQGTEVSGNAVLRLTMNAPDIRYLRVYTESADDFYEITCRMTDDNFSQAMQETGTLWMNPSQNTVCFPVSAYGTLYEAELVFRDVQTDTPVLVTAVEASNVRPWSFSLLRMLGLSALLCLLAAIRIFRWHQLCYDRTNLIHTEAIAFLLLFCICAQLTVCPTWNIQLTPYSLSAGVDDYDPYAQTFDAWQRGQLHLAVEPDPLLAALDNPYDRSAREAAGADAEWDKAYYQGRYYSYFGIAPVIFLYYPVWLCTGRLPDTEFAAAFFSCAGMVFLFLLILTIIRKYFPRVKLLLLLCGLAAAAAVSGLFLCAHYADRYYVAIAAGICFLCLFLWLGLEATLAQTGRKRCLLLAGCGTAVAAAVLSRPMTALYAVMLIPAFRSLLCRRELAARQKTQAVLSLAVPLAVGACVTMAYNAARFGSPFDFGTAYQLTVSNTAANRIDPAEFPAAMVHYFLNPLQFGGQFPYFRMAAAEFAQTGRYLYLTDGFGAFCFLCIPAALLILPQMKGERELQTMCIIGFLTAVLTAFLDFCMGGYNTRYLCDILPVLAVCSTAVLLKTDRRGSPLLLLQAPFLQLVLFLSLGEQFTIWRGNPSFYFILRDLFVFWQ